MKRVFLILSVIWLSAMGSMAVAGKMYQWKIHLAYGATMQVESHGKSVYALTDGALYSVEKQSENLLTWSKLTGLNGSIVSAMGYNETTKSLLVVYQDGLIDIIKDEAVYPMTDLKIKEMTSPKIPNKITMKDDKAYLAMPFGILCVDMKKREIEGSYYIGNEGKEENILDVAWLGDSIYAVSDTNFFAASKQVNLSDYSLWRKTTIHHSTLTYSSLAVWNDRLWVLCDTALFTYSAGEWKRQKAEYSWRKIRVDGSHLFLMPTGGGVYEMQPSGVLRKITIPYPVEDIQLSGKDYWIAAESYGLIRYNEQDGAQQFVPNGPMVNNADRLKVVNGKLYAFPGGRFYDRYDRPGRIMIYDGYNWSGIDCWEIESQSGHPARDFMNIAVDPFNPSHYFVTSYGTGLYEFNEMRLMHHYHHYNSPLVSFGNYQTEFFYIRTDAAMYDDDGNLWFLHPSDDDQLHILPPDSLAKYHGQDTIGWIKTALYQNGAYVKTGVPLEMFMDKRNSNLKWMPSCRNYPNLVLLNDNGTPLRTSDDRIVARNIFQDQDQKRIPVDRFYSVVQDAENDIWVGYDAGVFVIRNTTDFFQSDACERIKIPRNDGTNLADYLLNGEQVNAIAVDGMNRKWIGTETSGLYLMSADGIETIEHFTVDNSALLSDQILSLAIHPTTGEVFIGTGLGIMSYQSDATEAEADFSNVYAYPNPVRPDFEGVITITGLMDETVLYIVDEGANLVCKTRSNGGTAIWDGRNQKGNLVTPGVYSVLCNTANGGNHCVTKILVIR